MHTVFLITGELGDDHLRNADDCIHVILNSDVKSVVVFLGKMLI